MSASLSVAPKEASLQGTAASYYSWTINDKDVAVRLNLDVVDRLGDDVLRKFTELDKRGSEVGGILLGSCTLQDGKKTFYIEDYELAFCDYSCSALFSLSDECKGRMVDQLLRLKTSSLHSVIGFFRSHTRKDLGLDGNDLSLIREYFSGPENVFLLVKPFARKPSTAGFFIWENEQIRAESSYRPFPFKRSELVIRFPESIISANGEFVPAGVHAGVAGDPPEPLADNHVAQGATAIVSHSDAVDSFPSVKELPPQFDSQNWAAAAEPEPMELPQWDPEPLWPLSSQDREDPEPNWIRWPKPAQTPARSSEPNSDLQEEDTDPRSRYGLKTEWFWNEGDHEPSPPDHHSGVKSAPSQSFEDRPAGYADLKPGDDFSEIGSEANSRPSRTAVSRMILSARGWVWGLLAFVFVLVLGAGYLEYRTIRPTQEPVDAAQSLGLSVDRSGDLLVLRWDQNASLIAAAPHARVVITDGNHTEKVDLSPDQLRSGGISYSLRTDDVILEMEVADTKGGRSLIQRVRASGRSGALSQRHSRRARSTKAVQSPWSVSAQVVGPQQSRSGPLTSAKSTASPEPEMPVSVDQSKAGSSSESLLGSQPATSNGAPSPGTLPVRGRDFGGEPLPATIEPSSKPAVQLPDQGQPGDQAPVQSGKRTVPAKLIRSTPPEYPEAARAAHVAGVVRVQVVVGADGSVKDAFVTSGPPLLRRAALEAARRFVYEPATRNGQPVEFLTRVDFNFLGTR